MVVARSGLWRARKKNSGGLSEVGVGEVDAWATRSKEEGVFAAKEWAKAVVQPLIQLHLRVRRRHGLLRVRLLERLEKG